MRYAQTHGGGGSAAEYLKSQSLDDPGPPGGAEDWGGKAMAVLEVRGRTKLEQRRGNGGWAAVVVNEEWEGWWDRC